MTVLVTVVVTAIRVMFARGRMMQSMMCPFMKTLQSHHRYPQGQAKRAEKAGCYGLLAIHGCKESAFSLAYVPIIAELTIL